MTGVQTCALPICTFIFTGIVYFAAMAVLGFYLVSTLQQNSFFIMQLFFIPVLVYFFWWFSKVVKNNAAANFTNTMRMNFLASICTNAAFITLLILEKF